MGARRVDGRQRSLLPAHVARGRGRAHALHLCDGVGSMGRGDPVRADHVMLEEVARVVHLARELGEPLAIAPQAIDVLYHRYQNVYGQRPARVSAKNLDEGA